MQQSTDEALILAGGLGTRLRSVVNSTPKPMAPVAGKPFLTQILTQLSQHGFRKAVFCVGYLGNQVQEYFGDRFNSIILEYSQEVHPLGTGGALRRALDLIETENVLAMNGDSFCDIDLTAFARAHASYHGVGTIATLQLADRSRSGSVTLDDAGRICSFESASTAAGLINAGVYMLRRDAILEIPLGQKVSLEDEIFPLWVKRRQLFGWTVKARFIDIGTPESYDSAQDFFRQ